MTVYAKAPSVIEDTDYITPGKEYLVVSEVRGGGFYLTDDVGDGILCVWNSCAHLSGASWQRVTRPRLIPAWLWSIRQAWHQVKETGQ